MHDPSGREDPATSDVHHFSHAGRDLHARVGRITGTVVPARRFCLQLFGGQAEPRLHAPVRLYMTCSSEGAWRAGTPSTVTRGHHAVGC
jgi:hypothetical protein